VVLNPICLSNGVISLSEHSRAAVDERIRAVVGQEALSRFGCLSGADIREKKGPLDLVTVADRRVEEQLTVALTALLPGSAVIGEEAVHADPSLLDALHGDAPVWIVDPIDGTGNFVRGEPAFVTLVALAARGELLASWTYQPVTGLMATAVRGEGALLNGEPLRLPDGGAPDDLMLVSSARPEYLTAEQYERLYGLGPAYGVKACASGSAGCDYLDVARGQLDAVSYVYDNPWDHSAGLLLVAEAGGAVLGADGRGWRMGEGAVAFTAARDETAARRVVGLLGAAVAHGGIQGRSGAYEDLRAVES
jgi:fructose-1,6-bisphosphatase/inositol monophosphatase family enzyme